MAYPPAAIPAALAPRMARPRMRTVLLGARPAVQSVGYLVLGYDSRHVLGLLTADQCSDAEDEDDHEEGVFDGEEGIYLAPAVSQLSQHKV